MNCSVCGDGMAENMGNEETPVCSRCLETPSGREALDGVSVKDLESSGEIEEQKTDIGGSEGSNSAIKGFVVGILITLTVIGGYIFYNKINKEATVKMVLASRSIDVDSVDVIQYSTYPTNNGADLQNFIVKGYAGGYFYRAKVQYMAGRNSSENGVEFQQGSSTISSGTFYNF